MLSIAVMVSVGATPLTVVSEKSMPQGVEVSLAVPPVELTHEAKMSASVLSSMAGTVMPAGTLVPGARPVA